MKEGQDARRVHAIARGAEGATAVGGAAPLAGRRLCGTADGPDALALTGMASSGGGEDREVGWWGMRVC